MAAAIRMLRNHKGNYGADNESPGSGSVEHPPVIAE